MPSVPCDHETEDTMPIRWKRPPKPQVAGAPAHRYRSDLNGLPSTTTRSRQSNLVGWYAVISHCHTVSYEVNALLLQHALNRLNILLILAGNANVTLDHAVTVLKNFELKRDTVQTKNDFPTQ